MLNEAVRTDIDNSVLCSLATVDADGTPNVSPKEIFAAHGDDRIVVADIASPQSVKNLRVNPRACVSFIDVFRQRGFKIVGTAGIRGGCHIRLAKRLKGCSTISAMADWPTWNAAW